MSLDCPACESKAKCVNSRPSGDGTVNRRYHCACGSKFTSVEVIISLDGKPRQTIISDRKGTSLGQLRQNILTDLLRTELERTP